LKIIALWIGSENFVINDSRNVESRARKETVCLFAANALRNNAKHFHHRILGKILIDKEEVREQSELPRDQVASGVGARFDLIFAQHTQRGCINLTDYCARASFSFAAARSIIVGCRK
jgi:hypothetical protein